MKSKPRNGVQKSNRAETWHTLVDGHIVPYMTAGSPTDPPLVIIQGLGLDAAFYKKLAESCAKRGFFVLCPEQPGNNGVPDVAPNLKEIAKWNWQFLTAVGVSQSPVSQKLASQNSTNQNPVYQNRSNQNPVLIGHSLGGLISLQMLSQQPSKVKLCLPLCVPWEEWKVHKGAIISTEKRGLISVMGSVANEMLQTGTSKFDTFAKSMTTTLKWIANVLPSTLANPQRTQRLLTMIRDTDLDALARGLHPHRAKIKAVWAMQDMMSTPIGGIGFAYALGIKPIWMSGKHATPVCRPERLLRLPEVSSALAACTNQQLSDVSQTTTAGIGIA